MTDITSIKRRLPELLERELADDRWAHEDFMFYAPPGQPSEVDPLGEGTFVYVAAAPSDRRIFIVEDGAV